MNIFQVKLTLVNRNNEKIEISCYIDISIDLEISVVEQLNTVSTVEEAATLLKFLKSINSLTVDLRKINESNYIKFAKSIYRQYR